jgi:release factor glutamine methyltransferase
VERRVTTADALYAGRRRLEGAGIEDAGIEAEVLLRHALRSGDELRTAAETGAESRVSRATLFAQLRDLLDKAVLERYEGYLARRLAHEPSAYITGHKEFYGLDFEVTPAVLIPRPETETLVEAALQLARKGLDASPPARSGAPGVIIADIGTGSGCIAVALALALREARLIATDVSREAIEVARRNAARHGVDRRIEWRRGDLLEPLKERVDLIVANLPYVKTSEWAALPPELRVHEPRAALDGGHDGLDLIRRLLSGTARRLRPGGAVCLEVGDGEAEAVAAWAVQVIPGARTETRPDLGGRPRVVVVASGERGGRRRRGS